MENGTTQVAVRPAGTDTVTRGLGVFAARPFRAGETVLEINGQRRDAPSQTSIEVRRGVHIDVPPELPDEVLRHTHPWRFTNHACRPSVRVDGRALVALRDIAAGEEITFDYETTEASLAEPFACDCGAPGCDGRMVRGHRHSSPNGSSARPAPGR